MNGKFVPMLWDAIRYTVDHRAGMGRVYIDRLSKAGRDGEKNKSFRNRKVCVVTDAPNVIV